MKKPFISFSAGSILVAVVLISLHLGKAAPAVSDPTTISVRFSPKGGCTEAIIEQIDLAKVSIKVQAYRLTSPPIAKALLEAHKRGVKVSVLLDKAQQSTKYSDATFFHNASIEVLIDKHHAIAHNKIIIIDGATVITGSFNFSEAAETSNAENLLIISGRPALIADYTANFESHKEHCVKYEPPTGAK